LKAITTRANSAYLRQFKFEQISYRFANDFIHFKMKLLVIDKYGEKENYKGGQKNKKIQN